MVGGGKKALARVLPLRSLMGKKITCVGADPAEVRALEKMANFEIGQTA